MPSTDRAVEQYSGTLIQDLHATVVRAEKRMCTTCHQPESAHSYEGSFCPSPWPEPMRRTKFTLFDPMDGLLLRAHTCPEVFLAQAMSHLADRDMEEGDRDAWAEMKRCQHKLTTELHQAETQSERMIRQHLDSWLEWRAGGYDN